MKKTYPYYKLTAEEIFNDVNDIGEGSIEGTVEDINLLILPHVYPSHKFRTTRFVLRNLKDLLKDKSVCDMGCGPGVVGLFAIKNGAKYVVQADINPWAIKNADHNNKLHKLDQTSIKTYTSDCFDNIPSMSFDLIVFNMPYHNDPINVVDPLQYAFYDPAFVSIKKFLSQAKEYSHTETQIFIAFSNKGETEVLENIFEQNAYHWELWKITNTDQEYDNRIYRLHLRQPHKRYLNVS